MLNATVIGAVNIDITGFSYNKLNLRDSNIGKITTTIGGVGGNIAQYLALMGVNVNFITAIGKDSYNELILKRFEKLKINTDNAIFSDEYECGKYVSILDETNDMIVGINHMDINNLLSPDFFMQNGINDDILSVDCNLNIDSFEYILKRYGKDKRIVVDAVSMAKAKKIIGLEEYIEVFRPNRFELGAVLDRNLTTDDEVIEAACELNKRGVKKVIVTGADKNVFLTDSSGVFNMPSQRLEAVNSTGAGDCFTAGVIYSLLRNYNSENTLICAIKAAAVAVMSQSAVNDSIANTIL